MESCSFWPLLPFICHVQLQSSFIDIIVLLHHELLNMVLIKLFIHSGLFNCKLLLVLTEHSAVPFPKYCLLIFTDIIIYFHWTFSSILVSLLFVKVYFSYVIWFKLYLHLLWKNNKSGIYDFFTSNLSKYSITLTHDKLPNNHIYYMR